MNCESEPSVKPAGASEPAVQLIIDPATGTHYYVPRPLFQDAVLAWGARQPFVDFVLALADRRQVPVQLGLPLAVV